MTCVRVLQNKHLVDDATSQLDLQPYCSPAALEGGVPQKPLYSLASIVTHEGEGIHNESKAKNRQTVGGHYTALCRGNDAKWYQCNDSTVTECKSVQESSTLPYLLIFRRLH